MSDVDAHLIRRNRTRAVHFLLQMFILLSLCIFSSGHDEGDTCRPDSRPVSSVREGNQRTVTTDKDYLQMRQIREREWSMFGRLCYFPIAARCGGSRSQSAALLIISNENPHKVNIHNVPNKSLHQILYAPFMFCLSVGYMTRILWPEEPVTAVSINYLVKNAGVFKSSCLQAMQIIVWMYT